MVDDSFDKEWANKTDQEKQQLLMDTYKEMCVVNEDGLTFANKTADFVAYDRYIES